MPIRIPRDLPAHDVLEREGVMVMAEDQAVRQDIRPLQIGLLNLMPNKSRTETQFARLIGATPLQIEMTLIRMTEHEPKNTPAAYLEAFYHPFADIRHRRFDGLIVTGAPIELLPFEEVTYWDELTRDLRLDPDPCARHLRDLLGGAGDAAPFPRRAEARARAKAFGCFRHRNRAPASPFLRGFSDDFTIPVSRWTEIREDDLPTDAGLEILASAPETGPCLIHDPGHRALYMFNHIEYDTTSLDEEYRRDVDRGAGIAVPANYYPGNDPANPPENRWRSHAHLLFGNWINEVYQTVPFDFVADGD